MDNKTRCRVLCSESQPLLFSSSHQRLSGTVLMSQSNSCVSDLCIPSKAGILLVLYSAIIGSLYSTLVATGAIVALEHLQKRFLGHSFAISLAHILISVTTSVVPIGGCVADIICGRYTTYMISLFSMTLGLLTFLIGCLLIFTDFHVILEIHLPLSSLQIAILTIFFFLSASVHCWVCWICT